MTDIFSSTESRYLSVFRLQEASFIARRSRNKVIVLKVYLKITWSLRIPDWHTTTGLKS
jgi:hypothetical protein